MFRPALGWYQISFRFRKVTRELAWTQEDEITNIPELNRTSKKARGVQGFANTIHARKNNDENSTTTACRKRRMQPRVDPFPSFATLRLARFLRLDRLSCWMRQSAELPAVPKLPLLSRLSYCVHAPLGHHRSHSRCSPGRFRCGTATYHGTADSG
jgi:hypothetical protein